jgi:hypothetical protein
MEYIQISTSLIPKPQRLTRALIPFPKRLAETRFFKEIKFRTSYPLPGSTGNRGAPKSS